MPKVGMHPIRRKQLIEATLRVIRDVGLAEASVKRIAKEASLSNGIISHYFVDKEDLILAAARHLFAGLRARIFLIQQTTTPASPRKTVDSLTSAFFCRATFENHGGAIWLSLYAKSFHSEPLKRLISINRRLLDAHVARQFSGYLGSSEPSDNSANFVALVESLLLQVAIHPDEQTMNFVKGIAFDYLINLVPSKDCAD